MSRLYTQAARAKANGDTAKLALDDTVEKYAFKPMDFKEPEAAVSSLSHAGGTSIPIPDHARIGTTMTMNGKTYVLQETTPGKPRWHAVAGSTDKTQDAPGTHSAQTQPPGGSGKTGFENVGTGRPAPSVKGEWKKQGQGQQPDTTTHEQRHKHVAGQLGSAPQQVRGVIAAMHADPTYRQGGETATKSFDQGQAGGLRTWMTQNVGKQVQGGRVVNLAGGALGFSGPAGAIVVWAADAQGKHKVGYTNKTGIVAQALQGGGSAPAGGPNFATPPQIVGPQLPPFPKQPGQFSPKGMGQEPQHAAGLERIDRPGQPQPVSPPISISDTPKPSATPTEQMPPQAPEGARNVQHARSMFEEGMAAFAAEAARGLSQRGRGRWRAYTAALRSIWRNEEANARTPLLRQQKPAGQGRRGKAPEWQPTIAEGNQDFGDTLEKDATAKDPKRAADLKAMREHGFLDDAGYRKSLQGLMTPKGAAPAQEQGEYQPPGKDWNDEDIQRSIAATERTKPGAAPGQPTADAPQAAEHDSVPDFVKQWPQAPEQRRGNAGFGPDKPTKPADQGFTVPPPPKSDKPAAPKQRRQADRARKLGDMARQHAQAIGFNHNDAGHKLIQDAIAKGHIQNPRHVRGILKTAHRLHQRDNPSGNVDKDSAPHVAEAIRRKRNRDQGEAWQHRVDDYAADFDLTPKEFEDHAASYYGDFKAHHDEREGVKQHLRSLVGPGFSAHKLENSGKDSDALSPHDKNLQQLATEYPHIFRGDDHMETAWGLLKEGQKRAPALRSEEFLQHVAEQMGSRSRDRDEPLPEEDEGATPFTEQGRPERYGVEFEKLHPRARAGRFTMKTGTDQHGKFTQYGDAIDPGGNWKRLENIPDDGHVALHHATSLNSAIGILRHGYNATQSAFTDTPPDFVYLGGASGLGTYIGHQGKGRPMIVVFRVKKQHLQPDAGTDWKSHLRLYKNDVARFHGKEAVKNPTAAVTYAAINQVRAHQSHVEAIGVLDPEGQTSTNAGGWKFVPKDEFLAKHPEKYTLPEKYYFHAPTEAAARATATPTEAQAAAGNYKKGRVTIHGLPVVIEFPKGSRRKPEWEPLTCHYGSIRATKDKDGEPVDCFIGPHPNLETVFVIDQVDEHGNFNEHKIVFGCGTEEQARRLYLSNYPAGFRCGTVTPMTPPQFKAWLERGDQTWPVARQVSKYSYAAMVQADRIGA